MRNGVDALASMAAIEDAYAVAPADATDLPHGVCKALYITGAGNINIEFSNGNTIILAVPANYLLKALVKRVHATSTTATGIVACY